MLVWEQHFPYPTIPPQIIHTKIKINLHLNHQPISHTFLLPRSQIEQQYYYMLLKFHPRILPSTCFLKRLSEDSSVDCTKYFYTVSYQCNMLLLLLRMVCMHGFNNVGPDLTVLLIGLVGIQPFMFWFFHLPPGRPPIQRQSCSFIRGKLSKNITFFSNILLK